MAFLYEDLQNQFVRGTVQKTVIPPTIIDNLRPEFALRPYQVEALQRFLYVESNEELNKWLVFNMATGSGKTLIMAGLILDLYQKGYRNFLFFVHTTSILQKTKDNFLNPASQKYLFAKSIVLDGRNIQVREVQNFTEADDENINIKFTTIQGLHSALWYPRENEVTFDEFENHKVVFLADEYHHFLAEYNKVKPSLYSWQRTIKEIFVRNQDNRLYGFTATLDYTDQPFIDGHQPNYNGGRPKNILYKYALKEFRNDLYSKDVYLLRVDGGANLKENNKNRILYALLLNLYRQEVALAHNIPLKPVILFKSNRVSLPGKKTIEKQRKEGTLPPDNYFSSSLENQDLFHELIQNITAQQISDLEQNIQIPIIQQAFHFFQEQELSAEAIVQRIQLYFIPTNCLCANNEKEKEQNQLLLNSLEDSNNPIRVVFAVDKLNEGWDVLNLFDIVRLYETRDGRNGQPGKTTRSEAQLIGRGARYFPFVTEKNHDKYRRKFDRDLGHPLRLIEQLYYHTYNENRYISELRIALTDEGLLDNNQENTPKDLKFKNGVQGSDWYQHGYVVYNERKRADRNQNTSLRSVGVQIHNHRHVLSTHRGRLEGVYDQNLELHNPEDTGHRSQKVKEIPTNVVFHALHQRKQFSFDKLRHIFPKLGSLREFVISDDYMGNIKIEFQGYPDIRNNISNKEYLFAMQGLLKKLQNEIKKNAQKYTCSEWKLKPIREVFKDKSYKSSGNEYFHCQEDWFPYLGITGTTLECRLLDMFREQQLQNQFNERFARWKVIRNERDLPIYSEEGKRFEPDFLLIAQNRETQTKQYQVFMEPKGQHLIKGDVWKEVFLKSIHDLENNVIVWEDKEYHYTAVPIFFKDNNLQEFRRHLQKICDKST